MRFRQKDLSEEGGKTTRSNANMVNSCQTKVRVNVSLVATTATKTTHCYCPPVDISRCFLFFVCGFVGQSRNWTFNQQRRLMDQRQSQEEHRQKEARRVDRERQLQACLREAESSERKRYLRQVQEELHERQMESALLKVGLGRVYQAVHFCSFFKEGSSEFDTNRLSKHLCKSHTRTQRTAICVQGPRVSQLICDSSFQL